MAYLSQNELDKLKFKFLGKNVKISEKASVYDAENIEIGDNSRVDDFCLLSGKVKLGKHVHIAPFCLVAGGINGITLDDFSGLAYRVTIFSQSDDYSGKTLTNPTIPPKYKNEYKKEVYLSKHVIVGACSTIFPGVIVAEGCSIGAMSCVRKSTQPWGIYVGNPAKRIAERKKELLVLEALFKSETL